jgi:hypothetical protein
MSTALAVAAVLAVVAGHGAPGGTPATPPAARLAGFTRAVLTASHAGGSGYEVRHALASLDAAVRSLSGVEPDRAAIIAELAAARSALLGLPAGETSPVLEDIDEALRREEAPQPTAVPIGSPSVTSPEEPGQSSPTPSSATQPPPQFHEGEVGVPAPPLQTEAPVPSATPEPSEASPSPASSPTASPD